jgi:acetyltransferase
MSRETTSAEFAIAVLDQWQGQGIGAALLERCLTLAAERGLETIWGLVLPENSKVLALGRKLGFAIRRVPESGAYELRFDVRPALEGGGA